MESTTKLFIFASVAVCLVAGLIPQKRNIITDTQKLWPNGIIPVTFNDSVDGSMKEKILAAMQEISMSSFGNGKPCISFIPRTNEVDFVEFTSVVYGSGDSLPGKLGGKQFVHLYRDSSKPDVMQLLMYLLGFYNEFRRPDRDSFVTVHYENIAKEYQGFFEITNDTTFFNYPFDFESITFFFPYAWAMDASKPTLTAKYESQVIPYKVSLSKYDITNIQREYQCAVDNTNRLDLLDGTVTSCNFEFDLCAWVQETDDDFDFSRVKGPAPNGDVTGPQADYSSGIGYYVFATAKGNHNQDARVISPVLPAGEYCIRFYYFLYGPDVHKFRLNSRINGVDEVLESFEGNQGNRWHVYSNDFKFNEQFQFFFEAIMGGTDNGDMAFDDVYIFKGMCVE